MGDSIKGNTSQKTVLSALPARKAEVFLGCGEGEYLDVSGKGEGTCNPQESLGRLVGDGMKCDSSKLGDTPLVFPPKEQSGAAPAQQLKTLITGKAQYSCKTRAPRIEEKEIIRDVSIPAVSNESQEQTKTRLEKAAQATAKAIGECLDVRFVRFLPTAAEAWIPPLKSHTDLNRRQFFSK